MAGSPKPGGRPPAEAVTIAYIHSTEVAYSWVHSLIQLLVADLAESKRVAAGGFIAMSCNAGQIVESRNRSVEVFLAEDKADWLLWLDTDMGFLPDLVERLIESADPVERPIVGALCFSQRQISPDDFGGRNTIATPTIFDWVERGGLEGFDIRYDYPPASMVRCSGTGSAAILIHRSVFEAIQREHGNRWYEPIQAVEGRVGEDLSFCIRATALDFPIYVNTAIRTTHQKTIWLSEADFLDQSTVPPADQEVAVLVPVLERAEQAEPFMRSLRASTGLAKVYAICDGAADEEIAAWEKAGATVVQLWPDEIVLRVGDKTGLAQARDRRPDDRPGTFAEKVNAAFQAIQGEPWIFLCGTDVEFHADWLNQALAMAGDRYHVIGTNDLGNPRVMAGEHATHMLIRSSYVLEQGASWDGPGVVAHEGYRHWFVDDEIVSAAKQRGVWVSAMASKVEHLHPLWGKGVRDAVYTLGEQHMEEDRKTFARRLEANR
jgi:GT2 family glycosyltransferase